MVKQFRKRDQVSRSKPGFAGFKGWELGPFEGPTIKAPGFAGGNLLMTQEIQIPPSKSLAVAPRDGILAPRVINSAGDKAGRRFLEFFAATIRNKNTRMAYYRAAARFFASCDHHKIGEIADIEPLHVAASVEGLGKDFEKPTVKQTSPRSACCSTGWSRARSSAPIRLIRCAVRSTSSKQARRRC